MTYHLKVGPKEPPTWKGYDKIQTSILGSTIYFTTKFRVFKQQKSKRD